MISLSSQAFDLAGHIVLNARIENPYQAERRGGVTATLDQDVHVYDAGFCVGDQTLTATLRRPSRETLDHLTYLVSHYPDLILCCEAGVFRARVKFEAKSGVCALAFRLIERLD